MIDGVQHLLEAVPTINRCLAMVESRMASLVTAAGHDGLPRFSGDDAAGEQVSSGGGRMRARLAICAGQALGLSQDDTIAIAACAELLHNASLVHDDLQDGDCIRRGLDAVWASYGGNVAICAGDLLLSASFASMASLSTVEQLPRTMMLMHERIAEAVRGQGADLSFKERAFDVPTYVCIAEAKSGALLGLPIELALVAAGRRNWCADARRAANDFAVAYQIADDLEDAHRDRSFNFLQVLKTAGTSDPRAFARNFARDRLAAAMCYGTMLPDGCGIFLVALAERLSVHLVDEDAMAIAP